MRTTRRVLDGVPEKLAGVFVDGKAHVSFLHKCCRCATRHQVRIIKPARKAKMTLTYRRLENKKKNARSGNLTRIGDQEIFNLDGTEKGAGETHAQFIHCCNDCGLEHDVHIKKKPRSANMDITFVRLKQDQSN